MKPQLLAAAVVLITGCTDDDLDRCDPWDEPVESPGIERGIAGFGASVADVCDGLIPQCACQPGEHTFELYRAGDEVPDDDEARRLVTTTAPTFIVDVDTDGYEQPLDPAFWLACLTRNDGNKGCSLIDIGVDTVVSVHVVSSADLPQLHLYAADGTRLEPRTYGIAPLTPVDCSVLDEDACNAELFCIGGYGLDAEARCAGDPDVSVFYGCFERVVGASCGEEVVCIETPAGNVVRNDDCHTAGFERCEVCEP